MKFSHIVTLLVLSILPTSLNASVSNGTIEAGNKTALICHSVDCITPTPGVINFAPTGTTPVTISDTDGIDGVAWGNEIGWINFDPTGSEGLTINPATGVITGKAWSQGAGWINFSVTGQTVKINNDGQFEGYAWTGGPFGGWIKFDCSFAGACVKTDWRPTGVRPVANNTPAPGGSTSQNDIPNLNTNDFCLNIPGYQDRVPDNYAKDEGGLCVLNIDYCKNIDGVQLTVPNKYVLNGSGQCVILTDKNKDELVPDVTKETLVSSSTQIYGDYCPNLFGLQSELPEGFVQEGGTCLPVEADYCLNLLGNQYSVPANMKIANNGECIKMTPNEIEKNNVFKNDVEKFDKNRKAKVLGYKFIPDFMKLPVTFPFSFTLFGVKYQIDLLSLFLTLNVLGLIGLWFKNRRR